MNRVIILAGILSVALCAGNANAGWTKIQFNEDAGDDYIYTGFDYKNSCGSNCWRYEVRDLHGRRNCDEIRVWFYQYYGIGYEIMLLNNYYWDEDNDPDENWASVTDYTSGTWWYKTVNMNTMQDSDLRSDYYSDNGPIWYLRFLKCPVAGACTAYGYQLYMD
ncbi:MAG: hypothetical protein QNJ97_19220 [Myxococcota bacterium]|nr:hypothetical protein [Myxococcota bacterium]